jgi:hypothetical protein
MLRKSIIRSLFAVALALPLFSSCAGSVMDPTQDCGPQPETLQEICIDN